jgi:multimeric flavodoxin WrbA
MKVTAFNGSPRKKWNTATLLQKALDGAASKGAETELIHLYDYTYKGCISCFKCKKIDYKSPGKCAVKDELSPVLEKAESTDVIIFGTPIYFGTGSGEMRSFMERLLFPHLVYSNPPRSLFRSTMKAAFIYTMNVPEAMSKEMGFEQHIQLNAWVMQMMFGNSESLACYDTCQFDDYAKMNQGMFDPKEKERRRREEFPKDCEKAFALGVRLVG